MLKFKTQQVISLYDWDKLVESTYGRKYSFQQQDGCKQKGNFSLSVPSEAEDYENDTLDADSQEMGVSFAAWLARDPKEWKGSPSYNRDMFWQRQFYPEVQMVANDLHAKGLIPAGEYVIEIDW